MKRALSFAMALCLTLSLFCGMGVSASAASKQLTTINSFTQTLSYEQYNALRTGSYTAVKQGGTWYYKFTTSSYYVLVKASAFSGTCSNNYSALNSSLTKGVASTKSSQTPSYVYKARTTTTSRISNSNGSSISLLSNKIYKTDITYLKFLSSVSGSNVTLQCTKNGHALFEYSTYVKSSALLKSNYVKPSNATEYKNALKRSTYENSVSPSFTPKFSISVDKAGSNCVVLKEYCYKTTGVKSTNVDMNQLIEVAYTTGKVVASLAAKKLPLKTLYDLIGKAGTLFGSQSTFYMTSYSPLSKGNVKVLKATFTSPVKLQACNDYFEVNLNLSDPMSTSGTKTTLSVTFSA